MKLNVGERLTLLTILPKEGDLLTLRIIRDLQASLSFTEEDHVRYKIREEGTQVFWDDSAEGKDIDIGRKAHDIICSTFERLGKEHKLDIGWLATVERFLAADESPTGEPG